MRGVTLFETLVYCALFSMLITGIWSSAEVLHTTFVNSNVQIEELESELLAQDLKSATTSVDTAL